jgi:hypothetical protein
MAAVPHCLSDLRAAAAAVGEHVALTIGLVGSAGRLYQALTWPDADLPRATRLKGRQGGDKLVTARTRPAMRHLPIPRPVNSMDGCWQFSTCVRATTAWSTARSATAKVHVRTAT